MRAGGGWGNIKCKLKILFICIISAEKEVPNYI